MSDINNFPPIVYKYRDWNNDLHKTILTKNEIYFASPLDCQKHDEINLPTDYDSFSADDIFNYFVRLLIHENKSGISHKEICEKAAQLTEKTSFFNHEHRKSWEENFRKNLNEHMSIFCTSSKKDKMNLWNSFANYQTGFCIGFDTARLMSKKEFFDMCSKVNYYDLKNPPKLRALHFNTDERRYDMHKVIYNLPNTYKAEDEFRFSKFNIENKSITLPNDFYKEIIFGEKMTLANKSSIINLCKEKFPSCRFFESRYEDAFGYMSFIEISP